ncbi:MAG: acyltransferase [Candidatus Omnitrophota bacterium]
MIENSVNHRHYPFLDGFRAVAILGVLLAHIVLFFGIKSMPGAICRAFTLVGSLGHLGVDIFFVISGFLITGVLIKDFESSAVDIKRFYVRRFFKIIPQYLLVVVLGLGLLELLKIKFGFNKYYGPISYAGYFLYFQNYVKPIFTLAHGWSLAIEEHYYLLYPLFVQGVFFVSRHPMRRRQLLIGACIFLIILTIAGRHSAGGQDFLSSWLRVREYELTTLYRIDAIMFGCLLKFLEPFYENISSKIKIFFSSGMFLAGAGIAFYLASAIQEDHSLLCWDKYVLAYLATGFVFLAVYVGGVRSLNFIFENKLIRSIGVISYALYLWHYPLIILFSKGIPVFGVWICLSSYLIATFVIGYLSTNIIEKYFLKIRDKIAP